MWEITASIGLKLAKQGLEQVTMDHEGGAEILRGIEPEVLMVVQMLYRLTPGPRTTGQNFIDVAVFWNCMKILL